MQRRASRRSAAGDALEREGGRAPRFRSRRKEGEGPVLLGGTRIPTSLWQSNNGPHLLKSRTPATFNLVTLLLESNSMGV